MREEKRILPDMSSPQVLIIGHGYVGRALGGILSDRGCAVVAASRDPEEGTRYPEVALDVSDRESVRRLQDTLPSPGVIVHCASSGGGGSGRKHR